MAGLLFGFCLVFGRCWLWCEGFFLHKYVVLLVVGVKHVDVGWLWSRLLQCLGLTDCLEVVLDADFVL